MTTLASPSTNEIQNVIAVANSFVRGTDDTITLTDASAFPNAAHILRIRNLDNTKWCLIIYTSKAGNVLTMGGGAADYALAKCVTVGDEAYEWPAGSIVELVSAADEIAQLFTVDAAAGTGSLRTLGTTSQKACAGDDGRLSDARTPTTHKDSHDPIDGSDKVDTAAAAEISAVVAAGTGTSHSLARADHVHAINHAITDNHLVTVDGPAAGAPANGEYARWTANGVEGRQKSEVLSDLNVVDGADVTGSNAPQAHKDSHDPQDGGDKLDTANAAEIAGVQAAGTGSSHSFARADHTHQIQHGIANNHIVTVDHATPVATDYARFTANGLEGRESSEVKTDLGYMTDLVDDTTPQLGGNLDAQGNDIADLGVLNFDDATELTISVAETERLASEVAWTQVDGNCTVTEDGDDPDAGAEHSAKMAMAAGAAVGLQAYEDLGAGADLTGSSRIRVWIRVLTDDIAKGDFQLVIDNTAACASPIQYCDLPAQTVAANWVEVDIPYNPTLANMNDVNSFGLYMVVDKTCEILIHELRTLVGSVTRTQSYHKIDGEDGTAAETVLDTINGLVAGDELFLRAESGDRTVVLRNGTGNLLLPSGDGYSLDNAAKTAGFLGGASNWRLLALEGMITNAKARVYLSATQENLTHAVATKILLDAVSYDPSSMYTANKLTIQVPGHYLLVSCLTWFGPSVVATKSYMVRIYKNGVSASARLLHSSIVDGLSLSADDVLHLDVGNYLELYGVQYSGVNTVDVIGATDRTFLLVHLLSTD